MTYLIKIADITDPDIDLALRKLIKEAYNYKELLPANFLSANTDSQASKPGFFLVAEENGEIVGCNGFIANDFSLNEKKYIGYQSCWSVTHPHHQGKQIFTNLINEAKKILKAQGAGFLFGIANNKSNPIITKKLGFVETPALRLRIPNIPFIRNRYFSKFKVQYNGPACRINESQVLAHKRRQFPNDIAVIKFRESWLWGKIVHKKKYGINWLVFYVGGVQLSVNNDIKELVALIFKSYNISFVQFLSNQSNSFNQVLKGWVKPEMNGFIYFNLNMPEFEHFDIMIGVMDIF